MSADLVGGWTASEVQFVDLADQVDAEAVVRFLLDERNARTGVARLTGARPEIQLGDDRLHALYKDLAAAAPSSGR